MLSPARVKGLSHMSLPWQQKGKNCSTELDCIQRRCVCRHCKLGKSIVQVQPECVIYTYLTLESVSALSACKRRKWPREKHSPGKQINIDYRIWQQKRTELERGIFMHLFCCYVEYVGCELHPETHGKPWPQPSELFQHVQLYMVT